MQYNETLKTPQCRNNPKNHENHVDKQSVTVYHSVCTVIKVQDDYSRIMSSLIKRKPISYYYIIPHKCDKQRWEISHSSS